MSRIPKLIYLAVIVFAFFTQSLKAKAETEIVVSKSHQRMIVHSSEGSYSWPVSTARRGYYTPTGSFRPYSLQPMHYSRKYDNAPMPHSIFFSGGYAIHATPHTGNLGRPASHGCVRLSPGNAATLYRIVRNDMGETTIRIVN
jgi:lipoprotein-anchoring transpeptidase ErfK/SrfK